MTIINFSITDPLSKKINEIIKRMGFTSKAEFFRFITIDYIEKRERKRIREDQEIAELTTELGELVNKKFKNVKLPSISEQLEDLM